MGRRVKGLGIFALLIVGSCTTPSIAAANTASRSEAHLQSSPCVESKGIASAGFPDWVSFSNPQYRRWIQFRGSVTYATQDSKVLSSLMGPAGWRCNVIAGEDGSGLLAIGRSLAAARGFVAGRITPTSRVLLESAQLGCYSCQWEILCPILLRAGIHAKAGEGYAGCNGNPETRNELLRFLRIPNRSGRSVQRLAVLFWAPPHSRDIGTLSSSNYWTRGIVEATYLYKGGAVYDPATAVLSCQLPRSMAARCRSLEGWSLSRR
jgi:hypothetical protein